MISKLREKMRKSSVVMMLFFATFITALILSFNAVADIDAFKIVGAEVSARDAGVSGDVTSYDADSIESDTVFHHVSDTITYNLSVKNQHSKKYKIVTISDDNSNASVSYNYDKHEGEEVAGGASFSLVVTAEYVSGVASLNDRAQHLSVQFTITYEEVTEPEPGPEPTPTPSDEGSSSNPNTGDRLPIYITVLITSAIGLIICVACAGREYVAGRKKNYNGRKIIVCLLIVSSLIPVAAKALTEASDFVLTTDYVFMDQLEITTEIDGVESTTSVAYGSTVGALPTPSKDNYEFVGWKDESGTLLPNTTVLTEDTKLTAEFRKNKITVTFNANGGTPATTEKQVRINSALGSNIPADPTYENHLFDGWFTSADGGTKINADTTIGETDIEYFAHWTGKVTLADLVSSSFSFYDDETATIAVNNSNVIEGYTFSSLNESIATVDSATGEITGVSEGTTKIRMTGARSHEYIEIDVEIKRSLMDVTFEYQDGVTGRTTAQIRTGDNVGSNLPAYPARQGYFPTGWYTESTDGILVTSNTIIDNDVVFYLQWVKDVTLAEVANVTNDHFEFYDDETVAFNVTNAAEIEAYNLTSSNTSIVDLNITTDPDTGEMTSAEIVANGVGSANITMTGLLSGEQRVFTVTVITSSFTVNFDANGGSEVASRTVHRNTAVGELPEDPVWPGYAFGGWFTTADDSGEQITSATVINENPTTFYAHWTQKPLLCKKATERHTQTCDRTSQGCITANKYSTGDTITYGNIASSTPVPGDAYTCDVNGDGNYDDATERFYYLRNIDDNAVLIFFANYGTGGINHDDLVLYANANSKLPTTTDWPNVEIKFDDKAARLASQEDISPGCGGTNSVSSCEYLLEHTSFSSTDHALGRTAVWLQDSNNQSVRYRGDNFHFNRTALDGDTSTSGVRPTIEVPMILMDQSYRVTYDADGGILLTGSQYQFVEQGEAIGELPTFSKADYISDGWRTANDEVVDENYVPEGDIVLYAHYLKTIAQAEIESSDITLNLGEEKQIVITNAAEIGENYIFVMSSGSEFASVTSNGLITGNAEGDATILLVGSASGASKTINVHVIDVRDYYKVYLEENGGTAIDPLYDPLQVPKDGAVSTAYNLQNNDFPVTQKANHNFIGWYVDSGFNTKATLDTVVTGDTTYYAKWVPTNALAEVVGPDGIPQYPETLATLNTAIANSVGTTTVTILQDFALGTITIPVKKDTDTVAKDIILDLNGHTLSFPTSGVTPDNVIKSFSGSTLIKNGTVTTSMATKGAIDCNNSGTIMIIEDLTIISANRQALYNNGGDVTIRGDSHLSNSGNISDTQNGRAVLQNAKNYGTIRILSGTITANGNQTAVKNDLGTMIIGTQGGGVDASTPIIQGNVYGVEIGDSNTKKTYFYDGIIKGASAATNNVSKITPETGYEARTGSEVIGGTPYETLYLAEPTDPVSSDTIEEHWVISQAVRNYYDSVDTWNANGPTSLLPALKNNFDGENCAKIGSLDVSSDFGYQYADGGSIYCGASVPYDTSVAGAVNVYLSSETNKEKGDQVFYTKSESGKIYNMIPGQVYRWEKASNPLVYGYVKALSEDGKRLITAGSLGNVRDLGGMTTGGGTIKYGRLLRGEGLGSDADAKNDLEAVLGSTNLEYDLRKDSEISSSEQRLSNYTKNNTIHYNIQYDSGNLSNYAATRKTISDIMQEIVNGNNVYFHCRVGSDRTGTVAYILEGLLGVDKDTRDEEYELTTFSGRSDRTRYYDHKQNGEAPNDRKYVWMTSSAGAGLISNTDIYNWFMSGSTNQAADDALITAFRNAMLE